MNTQQLSRSIQGQFKKLSDPQVAVSMAAYMKTDMPFYGVKKPLRFPVYREIKKRFAPHTRREYEVAVRALWGLPHREEKYAGIEYARSFPEFISYKSVPLYKRIIREGAWWDFVDDVSIHLSGRVLLDDRANMRPTIEDWISHSDMWIRRAALLSQIKHKAQTDPQQLFDHCLLRADEKEFFIRKAIGGGVAQLQLYRSPSSVPFPAETSRPVLGSELPGRSEAARAGWADGVGALFEQYAEFGHDRLDPNAIRFGGSGFSEQGRREILDCRNGDGDCRSNSASLFNSSINPP